VQATLPGFVLVLVLACLFASGCHEAPTARAISTDLAGYLERMKAWAPVEGEAGRSIQRVLATQFVDHSTILHEIDEGIPRVDRHLRRIEAVVPQSAQVAAIHADYVAVWKTLRRGLESTRVGLLQSDGEAVASGREAMLEWRRGLRRVADALRALQAKHPPSIRPS